MKSSLTGHIKVEIKNSVSNLQWRNGEEYQRHKGLKHWERKRNQQLFFQHQFWFVQVYWEVYWVVGMGAIQIIQFIGSWMNQMHHNHVHCAPPSFLSQLDNLDSNEVIRFCCLWTCTALLCTNDFIFVSSKFQPWQIYSNWVENWVLMRQI